MQVWSYVFIVTRQPKRVLRAVRQIPGVLHADAIFGTPDVIAIVTGIDVAAMDAVVDRIAEIPDVVETDTKIARWIDGVELPASRMTAEKMAPQLSAALLSEERPERGSGGGHPESNPVAAFRAAVAEAAVAFSRRHPVVRLSVGAAGAILFLVGGLLERPPACMVERRPGCRALPGDRTRGPRCLALIGANGRVPPETIVTFDVGRRVFTRVSG
jgi:hypothetical protein